MARNDSSGKSGASLLLYVVGGMIAFISISNIIAFHLTYDSNVQTELIKAEKNLRQKNEQSKDIESTKKDFESVLTAITKNNFPNKTMDVVSNQDSSHPIAGLSCSDHGGPSDGLAEEMIFWSDIESDSKYRSPFYDPEKYVTFEPDHGGWNNIRMAMETVLVLAHAMGRTLVLPPEQGMYLLGKGKEEHKKEFSFNDFFHLDSISIEHDGFNIITMEEFLKRKGVTDQLISHKTNQPLKPPGGKTDWNGQKLNQLWTYLRDVGKSPNNWDPWGCIAAIPSAPGSKYVTELKDMMNGINDLKYGKIPDNTVAGEYVNNPTAVDAPTVDRLREMMASRTKLCIYDEELQNEELIHFKVGGEDKARLLTHFYAFVFFQDWRQDLWSKRFIRDHVRYIDEIICAAARVVNAVRERARLFSKENTSGLYDSFHIRRGDFQYKNTRIDIDQLYKKSQEQLSEGTTLFIATDEKDKSFFDDLKSHYDVTFLDDYMHLLEGVNPNYYGMLDQLIAYKGRVFFGTWFSTLSGYVNRMRGHYFAKHNLHEFEKGAFPSYYFFPDDKKFEMTKYMPVKLPIYMREFPTSWRDIDKGIDELHSDQKSLEWR